MRKENSYKKLNELKVLQERFINEAIMHVQFATSNSQMVEADISMEAAQKLVQRATDLEQQFDGLNPRVLKSKSLVLPPIDPKLQ